MQTNRTCSESSCPLKMMTRRGFLAGTGALALAASGCSQMSLLGGSSSTDEHDLHPAPMPDMPVDISRYSYGPAVETKE